MALGFTVTELLPRTWMGGVRRMGLVRVGADEWLWREFDRSARRATFAARPEAIRILPEGAAAAVEAARLVAGTDDFTRAAHSVWEDLCLLAPDRDGAYRLVAGALGFPTHWSLDDKLGQVLDLIHAPVPGYADQLASGVNHFFTSLAPETIFGRANWFVVPTPEWFYAPARGEHGASGAEFAHVTPANAGTALWVRCERQTLRRLPQSGAVLFTIGIAVARLDTLPATQIAQIAEASATMDPAETARRGASALITTLSDYAASLDKEA